METEEPDHEQLKNWKSHHIKLPKKSEREFVTKEQISNLMEDFPRNKNGQINDGCPDFRKLHQEMNYCEYPMNNDGSPDMRCTTHPMILKLKLKTLMDKEKKNEK